VIHLDNASVIVSGDLRIEQGMRLPDRHLHIAIHVAELSSRCSQCLSVAIVGAFLLANPRERRISPRPQFCDGHYPSHQSLLWHRSNYHRRIIVASRVMTPCCHHDFSERSPDFHALYSREVVIDISATVVDESKEIILIGLTSLPSNTTLRMTCMSVKIIPF